MAEAQNTDISKEQLRELLRNVYGIDNLPTDVDKTNAYWDNVISNTNFTRDDLETYKSNYVTRNSLGILEAVSSSLANNIYVPLSRVAVNDTGSFYQVLETDFTFFTDIITEEELIFPQNGTFFTRPNYADAHTDYDASASEPISPTKYVVYFATNNKIYKIPNYQTVEVELVKRRLTYDSIQIFENDYVTALLDKFGVTLWDNKIADWRAPYTRIAVYRPFPPGTVELDRTHIEVREGQRFGIRIRTRRIAPNQTYKYTITGVDANDINIPLMGEITTAGTEAEASAIVVIEALNDNRSDGDKTLQFTIDVPYDQTYGGGYSLTTQVRILERSVNSNIALPGTYQASTIPSLLIVSRNGRHRAIYQGDGNLVVSDTRTDQSSAAFGFGSNQLELSLNGSLNLRDTEQVGTINWQNYIGVNLNAPVRANSGGNGPTYLEIGDDGILRLRRLLDDVEIFNTVGGPVQNRINELIGLRDAIPSPASQLDELNDFRESLPATTITPTQLSARLPVIRARYNNLTESTKQALQSNTGTAFVNVNSAGVISPASQLDELNEFRNSLPTTTITPTQLSTILPGIRARYNVLTASTKQALQSNTGTAFVNVNSGVNPTSQALIAFRNALTVYLSNFDAISLNLTTQALIAFRNALTVYLSNFQQNAVSLIRTRYNNLTESTKQALQRNTAASRLAFVDLLSDTALTQAAALAFRTALDEYINGNATRINNVWYLPNVTYATYINLRSRQSKTLNEPDTQWLGNFGIPGGFGVPFAMPNSSPAQQIINEPVSADPQAGTPLNDIAISGPAPVSTPPLGPVLLPPPPQGNTTLGAQSQGGTAPGPGTSSPPANNITVGAPTGPASSFTSPTPGATIVVPPPSQVLNISTRNVSRTRTSALVAWRLTFQANQPIPVGTRLRISQGANQIISTVNLNNSIAGGWWQIGLNNLVGQVGTPVASAITQIERL